VVISGVLGSIVSSRSGVRSVRSKSSDRHKNFMVFSRPY